MKNRLRPPAEQKTNNRNSLDFFQSQDIIFRVVSYGLIVGMQCCLGLVFGRFVSALSPDWQTGSMVLLFGLVSIESIISVQWHTHPRNLKTSQMSYFLAEWVVILICIRVILFVWQDNLHLQQDVLSMQTDFITAFFSLEFFMTGFLVFLAWSICYMYASDLKQLESDEVLLQRADETIESNRAEIRKQVTNRMLVVGIVLVVAAGVADLNLPGLIPNVHETSGASEITIVVYFILGLLLMSLVHFAALQASWAFERIPIDPQIIRRWVQSSLVFLVLIGILALLLPKNYSLGLLDTLAYIFSWLIGALYVLVYLIMVPFMAAIALAAAALRTNAPIATMPPMPTMPPTPTPISGVEQTPISLGPVLQSILFWSVFLTIIIYAFILYIRQNKSLITGVNRKRGWRLVVGVLNWLKERLIGVQRVAGQAWQAGLGRLSNFARQSVIQDNWSYINPRSLTPRQRIRFFYLALLRRGAESGFARKGSETPYEYAQSLQAGLVAARQNKDWSQQDHQNAANSIQEGLSEEILTEKEITRELNALTDAFIEARYSRHEIPPENSDLARKYWDNLRRILTKGRRSGKQPTESKG